MTSADILTALRIRYYPPQWYLLSEVANGTGYKDKARETYADGVAINAYQTGKYGKEVHGFEIKVTRSDWQNELKDLEKSAEVRKFCDRWYVVAPEYIVKKDELPEGWGLIDILGPGTACNSPDRRSGQLQVTVEATKTTAALTSAFTAALVRRASEERAEREALKGALLKAPLRQVVKAPSRGLHVLVCGHLMPQQSGRKLPKSMRCLGCVDGLPIASELVLEGLKALSIEDAKALLIKAQASLDARARYAEKGLAWINDT